MESIEQRFIYFIVFLLSIQIRVKTVYALRECGEFHKDEFVQGRLAELDGELGFEAELNQYFDAFNNNDTKGMDDVLKLLQSVQFNYEDLMKVDEYKSIIEPVPALIIDAGYPSETHTVTTSDGYVLELHRIPFSSKSPKTDKPKTPVFLMHGFLESSNGWIVLGSENSIAYLLADAGYDVWMGNARGTKASRSHVTLNPNGRKQKQYWSYSWHEIGLYDLPASVDHVLKVTNHSKLHYVGFSQGTTSFLVLTSMRPEYNDKIIGANFLAPVAFLEYNRNVFYHAVTKFYAPLKRLLNALRIYKISLNNVVLLRVAEFACRKAAHSTPLGCKFVLSVLDSNQINCTSLPSILRHTPAGASLRQGIHYVQLMRSGGFRQYDFEDAKVNKRVYGQSVPPSYNLTQITAPVNLFYSMADNTGTFENVVQLKSQLRNVKTSYMVPINNFGHVDFVYSRYAGRVLNDKVIEVINRANAEL